MLLPFLYLIFVFSNLACQIKVGEEPPPIVNPKLTGTQCLSGVMIVAQDFVQGKAQDLDLNAGWDCLSQSVDKFKKYVRGRSEDRYDIQELATFLERNFFEKENPKKLSIELQRELMRFKKLFLGGSLNQITRAELDQTVQVFQHFKRITLKINPYMSLATFNWKVDGRVHLKMDLPFFEAATKTFQEAAKDLGLLIQNTNESYEIDHVQEFLTQLSKFYNQSWPFLEKMPHYLGLVKKVKKTLAGGLENTVSASEWKKFLGLGVRSYFQYLRYHYFIKNVSDVSRGERLSYISKTFEDVFGIAHELVLEKEKNYIDKSEIIETLFKLSDVFPVFKVSNQFIDQLMILKKLFVGGSEQGWTLEDIHRAKSKVTEYHQIIERLFPYYSYFVLEENQTDLDFTEQLEYFSEFYSSVDAVSEQLGSLLESDYSYNDLLNFIKEFDLLYPPENSNELTYSFYLKKYQGLFESFKKNSFLNEGGTVLKSEWTTLFKMGLHWGSSFLFHYYYIDSDRNSDQGHSKILRYKSFSDHVFQSLRSYLSLKKNKHIEFDESWDVLVALRDLKVIPQGLKKESYKKLFLVISQNLLTSRSQRLEGSSSEVIDVSGLEYFKSEYLDQWYFLEDKYHYLYLEKNKILKDDILKYLMDASTQIRTYQKVPLKRSVHEMYTILNIKTNLSYDPASHIIITGKKEDVYDYSSLNILNSMRMVSKWVINSFSMSQEPFEILKGISQSEVQVLYDQVKDFFVDLEMLRPNDLKFANNRFVEGNLFTPSAVSDSYLSFNETVELLALIYSGMNIDQEQKRKLKESQCLPQVRYYVTTELSKDCFLKVYREQMTESLGSMPDLKLFGLSKVESCDGFE